MVGFPSNCGGVLQSHMPHGALQVPSPKLTDVLTDVLAQVMARVEERLADFQRGTLSDCHDVAAAAASAQLEAHAAQWIGAQQLELRLDTVQGDVDCLYHLLDLRKEDAFSCRSADTPAKLRVLHQLPVFGLILQRLRKLEDEGQFFSKRIGKSSAILEGKADSKALEALRADLSNTRQRFDANLASLEGRLQQLDRTKADISVHKLLGDAKLGLLALEDLRTDLALDMEKVNGGLTAMRDHLRVLTEENDAFREALQQLKDSQQKSRRSRSVLERLGEVSRLQPDWADINRNRITAALSLASADTASPPQQPSAPPLEDASPNSPFPATLCSPLTPHVQQSEEALHQHTTDVMRKQTVVRTELKADSVSPAADGGFPAAEPPTQSIAALHTPSRPPPRATAAQARDPTSHPSVVQGPPHVEKATLKREVVLRGSLITRRNRAAPRSIHTLSLQPPRETAGGPRDEVADVPADAHTELPEAAAADIATPATPPPPSPPPLPPPAILYDGIADLTILHPDSLQQLANPLPGVVSVDSEGAIIEYHVPMLHHRPIDPQSLWVGRVPNPAEQVRRRGPRSTTHRDTRSRQAPGAAVSQDQEQSLQSVMTISGKGKASHKLS
eukprot:GGOE01042454.1.p1 GENE.GGOE01042454.1~~GGOE01042454.1.p1  ORF type:complete len:618 (-),score=163.29 GGOE01042454.1:163-2016(-)